MGSPMRTAAALSVLSLLAAVPAVAAPDVVASTKPIHAIVARVMEGVGAPVLLVKGAASPHTYSLKPSDADALQGADIVFWTGHGLEAFLEDAIGTLAPGAQSVALSETPGLDLLPLREGGAFEPHADEGEDHDHAAGEHAHEEGGYDMHFFLDPQNAILMAHGIAATLAAADPDNAAAYGANADAFAREMDALTARIDAELAPVRGKPFVVFHDAYQYFERRFGLDVAGSITVSPEAMPGAQRVDELRAKVVEVGAACVFAEPNFQPAIVQTIIEGTNARAGTLDPEGAGLAEGPGLYSELIAGLADGVARCLAGTN